MKRILVSVISASMLFCACQKINFGKKPSSQTSKKPEGPVLAKVGQWYLIPADFDVIVKSTEEDLSTRTGKSVSLKLEEKKALLTNLVNQEILAQYARKKGINKRRKVRLDIESAVRGILVGEVGREMLDSIDVSYKEIEDWYEKNKDRYRELREPEKRKVREIVVSNEATAKKVLAQIYGGEDFASLAQTYSESLSKDKGGDLGYIEMNPDEKFPRFWQVVFDLEKGEVRYFKSPEDKYYIVKVEDIIPGKTKPLTQVQDKIRDTLKLQKYEKKLMAIIDATKNEVGVEINEDLLH